MIEIILEVRTLGQMPLEMITMTICVHDIIFNPHEDEGTISIVIKMDIVIKVNTKNDDF